MSRYPFPRLAASVLVLLAAGCVSPAPQHAFADENGDPARGRAYAEDRCAQCHAVRGGQDPSPIFTAPTFQEIADTPGFTRIALGAWLRSSHQQMPDFIIETEHIDDVYVYLETLRTRRSAPQDAPH